MTESEKQTIRDVIERARENGFRELADTMDVMLHSEDPYEISALEQPAGPNVGLPFRTGMILGRELVNKGTDDAKIHDRENFLDSLRDRNKRALADSFEYCMNRKDEVMSDDFQPAVLPLEGAELFAFGLGLSFSIALERARKS